jgi:pimeloyl-ACP methyl ester carboxylesterase
MTGAQIGYRTIFAIKSTRFVQEEIVARGGSRRAEVPALITRLLLGADHYHRWLPRELRCAPVVTALLATLSSFAYANCSEFEEKFIVGSHAVVSPPTLADQPHPLVFCNLLPDQSIRITSLMITGDKRFFSSTQTFQITRSDLNTAKDAPEEGSYSGVESDGYFWSMTEAHEVPPDMLSALSFDPTAIIIKAESQKNGTMSTKVHRDFALPLTNVQDIRSEGIVGKLFMPKQHDKNRTAVVIIPGAGGPNFEILPAYLLAARGFTVFSLAYYGLDDLPQQLESIPIEYFSRAVDYLRRKYIGSGGKIVLLGISRGTEAAAMLALQRIDIDGLVLLSTSSVLNSGWGTGFKARMPAWTLHGSALPFMPSVQDEDEVMQAQTAPYRTRALYDLRLNKLKVDDPARIPFGKIKGDVILLSCDQDEVWPSARMSADIVAAAKGQGKINVMSYVFRYCGHDLGAPVAPTTGRTYQWPSKGLQYTLGGTPQATWHGQTAAWSGFLKYLRVFEEN